MLEEAISQFNTERTQENLLVILELLSDSYVWVPCTAVLSEADQARFEAFIENSKDNLDSLVGESFTANDETRMIPDILQSGDEYFFPAFTTAEAMGEYGENFSKMEQHMLDVIRLARNNDRELAGIVINAFSEPFILQKEIWDVVEGFGKN